MAEPPLLRQFLLYVFALLIPCFVFWTVTSGALATPAVGLVHLILTHWFPDVVNALYLDGPNALLMTQFGEMAGELVPLAGAEYRLGFQLELARRNGHDHGLFERGMALQARLPQLLGGHSPSASLLHGDLWGGNWGALRDGEPVIFDPAVYFGDRETDLAMTQLFRGYPAEFYSAYEAAWPLAPGYEQRFLLYNLYHVLNHLNLFGQAYAAQASGLMDRLLR